MVSGAALVFAAEQAARLAGSAQAGPESQAWAAQETEPEQDL